MDKTVIELGDVQKTLLLPLWGRAVESLGKKPRMLDPVAVEIVTKLDYDFSTMAKNLSPITQYAWIARSLHIDRTIRQFLAKHPQATIVNIGCGLDTTFDRVDNGTLHWYDLDLTDTIQLRSKFIPEQERRRYIRSSFLAEQWLQELQFDDNLFFFAAGVFYYFAPEELKGFFTKLAHLFPGSEMMFDEASPLGVRVSNKKVISNSGMDEKSFLKWGLESAQEIQEWDQRIKVIEEYPMFQGMKQGLSYKMKYGTWLSDKLKIMSMVHLKM